jgi:hypothetical protein
MVLKDIASLFKAAIASDLACRLGARNFAGLYDIPTTAAEQRAAIFATPSEFDRRLPQYSVRITISVGIAEFPCMGEHEAASTRRPALTGKIRGRNRVMVQIEHPARLEAWPICIYSAEKSISGSGLFPVNACQRAGETALFFQEQPHSLARSISHRKRVF